LKWLQLVEVVVVRFVDIGRIVDHYCLSVLELLDKDTTNQQGMTIKSRIYVLLLDN
jgi:hypothetical protein